jgi:integrase
MDLTTGWWTIPGERSKNGLDHRVPLSPQASRILKDLRNITDKSKSNSNSKWVFPSTRKTGPHITTRRKRSSESRSGQLLSSGITTCDGLRSTRRAAAHRHRP